MCTYTCKHSVAKKLVCNFFSPFHTCIPTLTYLEVTKNQKSYGHTIRNTLMVAGNGSGPRHNDGVEKLDGAPNPEEDEDNRN